MCLQTPRRTFYLNDGSSVIARNTRRTLSLSSLQTRQLRQTHIYYYTIPTYLQARPVPSSDRPYKNNLLFLFENAMKTSRCDMYIFTFLSSFLCTYIQMYLYILAGERIGRDIEVDSFFDKGASRLHMLIYASHKELMVFLHLYADGTGVISSSSVHLLLIRF